MNIKLHEVISSLTGASGLAVIRAILADERDPQVLLVYAIFESATSKLSASSKHYAATGIA